MNGFFVPGKLDYLLLLLKVTAKAIKHAQGIVRDNKKRFDIVQKDSDGEKE